MKKYTINEEMELLEYLITNVENNKKKAKMFLSNEMVSINGKVVRQFNYKLKQNDILQIKKYICPQIEILYEDKYIIVVDKPSGLLSIQTEQGYEDTLFNLVSDYVKRINKNNRIFIVHRLDKDTSGVIIFAKNLKTKNLFQENWNDIVKYRIYVAIVEGNLSKKQDKLTLCLNENKNLKVYVSTQGKKAITEYKVIKETAKYSLLDINIQTGIKNQIRATFEHLEHPILGDRKYGSKDKALKRLALHAHKLTLENPINHQIMTFESSIPIEFTKIMNLK